MRQTFEDEYMDRMRRRYAKARTRADKTKLIDEAIKMCNLSRKFVIRLLNGSYRYHPHCGRAPTYSQESRRTLVRIWLAMGQMCPLYLHAVMDSAIRDYAEAKASIPEAIADELRRMSVSTITRIIRPHRLVTNKAKKRSGSKAALAAQIPAGPGRLDETGEPGVLQVDTVALCGGDMRESFFWIVHVTDAATQWTACAPTWNRGPRPPAKPSTTSSPTFPSRLKSSTSTTATSSSTTTSSPTSPPTFPMCDSPAPAPTARTTTTASSRRTVPSSAPSSVTFVFQITPNFPPSPSCVTSGASSTTTPRTDVKGLAYCRIIDTPRTPWQRLNALLPQPPPPHLNAILLRRRCEKTLRRLFLTQHP